jgi:hypothetical protein
MAIRSFAGSLLLRNRRQRTDSRLCVRSWVCVRACVRACASSFGQGTRPLQSGVLHSRCPGRRAMQSPPVARAAACRVPHTAVSHRGSASSTQVILFVVAQLGNYTSTLTIWPSCGAEHRLAAVRAGQRSARETAAGRRLVRISAFSLGQA